MAFWEKVIYCAICRLSRLREYHGQCLSRSGDAWRIYLDKNSSETRIWHKESSWYVRKICFDRSPEDNVFLNLWFLTVFESQLRRSLGMLIVGIGKVLSEWDKALLYGYFSILLNPASQWVSNNRRCTDQTWCVFMCIHVTNTDNSKSRESVASDMFRSTRCIMVKWRELGFVVIETHRKPGVLT